ncbi:MAG: response regulator transcription factor [Kiritimatiellae bacterium]|nr:response regulator transcription factor [Kiritimatiellia bacterium]
MITVLIADDHESVRWGLKALLEKEPDIKIVAEAEDGRTAVALAKKLSPCIAIVDIAMPDLNGIEATNQIIIEAPNVRVIALSAFEDTKNVENILKAGAMGYVLKSGSFKDVVSAVRAVAEGHTYLSPQITGIIVKEFVRKRSKHDASSFAILTPRERETLQLLTEGKTPKEVADILSVSVTTVHTHRTHIMEKLNIYTTAELTKYAIREGLTSL